MPPAALTIIRDEHRTLTAVLQGLQFLVKDVRDREIAPDFELFTIILDYIDVFPDRFHHPKENDHLFKRLRARTREADAVLDELEAEHAQGERLIHELRHALALWRVSGREGLAGFARAVDGYVDLHWTHMRKEEDVVMPLAERALAPEDWAAIDAAFRANDDPVFGAKPGQEFRRLFQLIVNLAPPPLGVGEAREAPKR
ncbi:MAG: hemerythrin domain-containing protein [Candidatus Rokubacteria bacterium]|nr:hemerythrin domain-containing protein [Candidatus Rokubacteria bacterium]